MITLPFMELGPFILIRGISTIFEKEYGNGNCGFCTQANSIAYSFSLIVGYFLVLQKQGSQKANEISLLEMRVQNIFVLAYYPEEIVLKPQFLRTTREQRETLQVELSILDVDTWRLYSQEGQSRIRRAELTRSRKEEEGKATNL
jgi:hypothetical protein